MNIEQYCNEIIKELNGMYDIDPTLQKSFITVIKYLNEFPKNLSIKKNAKNYPDIKTKEGIGQLGCKYFSSYYTATIPTLPKTVPDEMVSLLMKKVFGYSDEETKIIKKTHSQSMAAENAVGTLLERYLDSVLRPHGWAWCCGNFVKATDFIKYENGKWFELQIKNRSNTENSSSNKIREGTSIYKWYRISANNGNTKWDKLPEIMQGYNLSEEGFRNFVEQYLKEYFESLK